jgi:hypothetical protein
MRLTRTSVLLWFGLLGAPAAWTGQFVIGYWLSEIGCSPGGEGGLAVDAWTVAITAVAALLAALAELAAIATFRRTRGARGMGGAEEPPPNGRVHFLATVGIVIAPLFFLIIVMSGVGVAVLQNCRQG